MEQFNERITGKRMKKERSIRLSKKGQSYLFLTLASKANYLTNFLDF